MCFPGNLGDNITIAYCRAIVKKLFEYYGRIDDTKDSSCKRKAGKDKVVFGSVLCLSLCIIGDQKRSCDVSRADILFKCLTEQIDNT